MTSTVDVLRAARDLYAQAPSHAGPDETPKRGTYCALYALAAVGDGEQMFLSEMALRFAAHPHGSLVAWNAKNSTETVLAAFDRAIEAEALKVEA